MKRVLMLGGSMYQTYAIKEAVKLGYYVITCDYLPDNPGHQYAHEYYNVSTTDKDAVLDLAKRLKVDGIVAYASDVAAMPAAYASEKLGLPTSPYESVRILSTKDLFRSYLKEHGFNVPKAQGFSTYEEALEAIEDFKLPVMVKPVDSAGSKGVNKMTDKSQLKAFVEDALHYSLSKRFVIEEFIVKKGPQISGDAFSVNGKIVFHCLGNEFYNPNYEKDFAPLGECWPFSMNQSIIDNLMKDIQRLITSLGMKSTAYNVEAIVGEDDKIYLIELGARAGGSLIPQLVEYVTGVNYVPYVIKAAVGDDCSGLKMAEAKGCWSNYMVHPNVTGKFESIEFDDTLKNHIAHWAPDVKIGENVYKFRGAQDCIGELILKYDSEEQMNDIIENMDKYITIKVK